MKIVKFISRDTLENSRFFLQTVCAYLNTQKDGLFCSLIPRTSSLFGGDPEKSRARGTRKKTLQRGLERNSSSPLASAFFFFFAASPIEMESMFAGGIFVWVFVRSFAIRRASSF